MIWCNAERDRGDIIGNVYRYTSVARARARICVRAISCISASRWKIRTAKARRGRERRATERARLHFPLAVTSSFLRILAARWGTPALVLIINGRGFGSGCHFFSLSPFFPISSTPHLLFSCATNLAFGSVHCASASREHYTVRRSNCKSSHHSRPRYSSNSRYIRIDAVTYPSWRDFTDKVDGRRGLIMIQALRHFYSVSRTTEWTGLNAAIITNCTREGVWNGCYYRFHIINLMSDYWLALWKCYLFTWCNHYFQLALVPN